MKDEPFDAIQTHFEDKGKEIDEHYRPTKAELTRGANLELKVTVRRVKQPVPKAPCHVAVSFNTIGEQLELKKVDKWESDGTGSVTFAPPAHWREHKGHRWVLVLLGFEQVTTDRLKQLIQKPPKDSKGWLAFSMYPMAAIDTELQRHEEYPWSIPLTD